ncbi:MAG: HEAT repeat domain-containing protein [candidate division WOR-3 bacterium]|nr:MAG: HEAT repeat domain-containing protein [candidate division WOR-3 bacterium]
MDQRLIQELMTEVAAGLDAARSYTLEHPALSKAVSNTISILQKIFTDNGEFSVILSDGALIVGNSRTETPSDSPFISFVEELVKKGVASITFRPGVSSDDIVNLHALLVTANPEIKGDGFAQALTARGVQKVLLKGTDEASSSEGKPGRSNTHEEIIKAIRALIKIVRERAAVSDARVPFADVMSRIEHVSSNDWHPYREAMASVVDLLPVEKRVALLQDIEIRPFSRSLLSRMGNETLIEVMNNWERQGRSEQIVKVMSALDREQLKEVVPQLRNRQLNIHKYLIHAGIDILTEEAVSSTIEEHDLETALEPYDGMIEAQNTDLRAGALRSLIVFADRLAREKKYVMAREVVSRISSAIEGEPSDSVIERVLSDLALLYDVMVEHGQADACEMLIEPFGKILGRTKLSLPTRKHVIGYLRDTRNPSVLHMLFSLLWESGLYPDVRSAIVSFGGDAVSEAIQLLRDAEDFSVRMKLIDVLKNIGKERASVLTENLHAREWYLRRNIVRIFGEIGDPDVIPELEGMLNDEDYRVRIELVRTFSKFNQKESLQKALDDSSAKVKAEALRGLRRMLDAEEVIELLSPLGAAGDEVYVELLKIVDEKRVFEAVHWIGNLLKRIEWRKDATANEIKVLGVNTLAKLGGDDAKMHLLDLSNAEDRKLSDLASSFLKRMS